MSKHLRLLSFILLVSILFSLSTSISLADTKPGKTPAPATTYSDPELARAVSLGIGSYAKFSGNTYVQNIGGFLAEWGIPKSGNDTKKYLFGINAEKTVKEVLGDKKGIVLK